MKNLKYSVGIDMSKNDFKACISIINEQQNVTVKSTSTFNNTAKGFEQLLQWVSKHRKEDLGLHFLLEATGVYHEPLAWFLYQKNLKISVLLPNKAKRYIQSIGIKSKNDKIDSIGLAQMCSEQNLPEWKPISKNIYKLRGLTRLYEDLNSQKISCMNRIKGLDFTMHELKDVKKSMLKVASVLDAEMKKVLALIKKTIGDDPVLHSKYKNISQIKGVGLITFAVIVSETNGFEMFNSTSQLVSYAGYDVCENQSGNRNGRTRMSKKGNSHIRRVLHLPAFTAVKHEPVFREFYTRVFGNTQIKMKAYVAVQRKLLCLIYSLWKNNQVFDPDLNVKKHSKAEALDSLWVDSEGIIKKAKHEGVGFSR